MAGNIGMTLVRVKAPATTANMGPGYDCLGMALDVWNTIEIEVLDSGEPVVEVTGEGAGELGTGRDNLVYRSMEFLFQDAEQEMPLVRIRCDNAIPLARGMGSSAAAIAGGLVAANAICSQDYTPNDLLEMAAVGWDGMRVEWARPETMEASRCVCSAVNCRVVPAAKGRVFSCYLPM